jgi:hypothetical protein
LKFNAALADRPLREMKPLVRRAHAAALPFIGTKDFDSTWTDFVHAWGQARFPLGVDVLTEAWKRAQTDPAPAVADDYDSAPVRRLVGLCDALARFSPDSRFFLSTHSASRLIGASAMQVCRWLRMLVADSVLKVEHVGNEHRATRYQWTAPKDGGAR